MSRNFELLKQLESEADITEEISVPIRDRTIKTVIPPNLVREEVVRLVRSIFVPVGGSSLRKIAFCSVDSEAGSSSVCAAASLALAAITERTVCVIDANVRSSRLSSIFGIGSENSLPSDRMDVREQCAQIQPNLWLAPAELLSQGRGTLPFGHRLQRVFKELESKFDYLLVDTPAISASDDATELGQFCDATILVLEANSTRRVAARKAKEKLESVGVRLLGTILNNRTFAIPDAIYRRL